MKNISITPGKNNVGAYIENIDLKKLDKDQISTIKDTLNNYEKSNRIFWRKLSTL